MTTSNLALIRSTYEGPSEENGKHLLAALAHDAEWVEAAGFPDAGTYTGPDAIIANVFHRLATESGGYRAEVASYMEAGGHRCSECPRLRRTSLLCRQTRRARRVCRLTCPAHPVR